MNIEEKTNHANALSRRRFVWGFGMLSAFSAFAASIGLPLWTKKTNNSSKVASPNKTVKMLTEDGRLVEIDASLLSANQQKITDTELKNWIKK